MQIRSDSDHCSRLRSLHHMFRPHTLQFQKNVALFHFFRKYLLSVFVFIFEVTSTNVNEKGSNCKITFVWIHLQYTCKYMYWLYPCITNVTSFTSVTWWTFPSSRTAFIACASHVIARAVVSAVIRTSLNAVHTVPFIIAFCCLRKWKRDSTAYVIFYVLFCFEIHHEFNTNNLNFVITSNIK